MIYLHTSVLAASLMIEPASRRVCAWQEAHWPGKLLVSDWCITEIASVLALKSRMLGMIPAERRRVQAMFDQLLAETYTVVPVTSVHFRAAARLLQKPGLRLRAKDALHLAVAAEHGATVGTLDPRMVEAGPVLGVAVELVA